MNVVLLCGGGEWNIIALRVIMKEIMKLIINIFKMIQTYAASPIKAVCVHMKKKNGDHTPLGTMGWAVM